MTTAAGGSAEAPRSWPPPRSSPPSLLVGGTDDTVTTPATDPSRRATPAPTVAPDHDPRDAGADAPARRRPHRRPRRRSPAGPGDALTAGPEASSSTAGAERATLDHRADGDRPRRRRRPGDRPAPSGDGAGQGWTDADTVPLVLAADGSLTELFGTADWDGDVVLHDIEVVDGRRLLLFSLQVAMNVNPDNADETLYVVDLDTAGAHPGRRAHRRLGVRHRSVAPRHAPA